MATIHRVRYSLDNITLKDSQDYLVELYLNYLNDFVTFSGWAEYHELPQRVATTVVKLGSDLHSNQANKKEN